MFYISDGWTLQSYSQTLDLTFNRLIEMCVMSASLNQNKSKVWSTIIADENLWVFKNVFKVYSHMFGNVPQLTSSLSDSWKFLCQATQFTDFSGFETSSDTFRTMCTS